MDPRWRTIANNPRSPVALIAALHLVISLVFAADPLTGHDEGQLMFGFARGLALDFWPNFFWQKSKPALALLYLPAAKLGFGPYLVLHALVSAAAVALVGEVARGLGHKRPWISSLVLACSPLFAWCTLVGISNSDGVAFLVLSLFTLVVLRSPGWTGLVLGIMPWVRYECAVFAAVLGGAALWTTKSPRLLLGALAWPSLYLGAGAIYHRSLLWFLRFPPGVSTTAGIDVWEGEFAGHNLTTLVTSMALVSPALVLLVLLRLRSASILERAMALFVALFLGLFAYTHGAPKALGPAFILGFSARYALIALPAVALLVSRALDALEEDPAPRWIDSGAVAGLVAAGWWLVTRKAGTVVLWGASAAGAVVAALRSRRTAAAGAALAALVLLGPLALRDGREQPYDVRTPWLGRVERWLDEHRQGAQVEVYTNSNLFPLYAERRRPSWLRVRFLLAVDMAFELEHLTNPDNGQRKAVAASAPRAVFGDVVWPEELEPSRVPAGTLFVLVEDSRTRRILPPERWKPHLQELTRIDGVTIARFVP